MSKLEFLSLMDASSFLEINPAILERKYRQYNFALNDYFCLEKGIALHFNKLDLSQIVLNRGKNIGEKFAIFPMRKEPIFQPKLNWLVDCLYIVLRPTRKYSIHMEPSPLSGLKNLGLNCFGIGRNIYNSHSYYNTGQWFSCLAWPPRVLRTHRLCWNSWPNVSGAGEIFFFQRVHAIVIKLFLFFYHSKFGWNW